MPLRNLPYSYSCAACPGASLYRRRCDLYLRRILFIINPAGGKGEAGRQWSRLWPALQQRAESCGLRVEQALTEYAGHAISIARGAKNAGYDVVVAVGGDGSINEVANGLVLSEVNAPNTGAAVECAMRHPTRHFALKLSVLKYLPPHSLYISLYRRQQPPMLVPRGGWDGASNKGRFVRRRKGSRCLRRARLESSRWVLAQTTSRAWGGSRAPGPLRMRWSGFSEGERSRWTQA